MYVYMYVCVSVWVCEETYALSVEGRRLHSSTKLEV